LSNEQPWLAATTLPFSGHPCTGCILTFFQRHFFSVKNTLDGPDNDGFEDFNLKLMGQEIFGCSAGNLWNFSTIWCHRDKKILLALSDDHPDQRVVEHQPPSK
jgi:hypothetical protein